MSITVIVFFITFTAFETIIAFLGAMSMDKENSRLNQAAVCFCKGSKITSSLPRRQLPSARQPASLHLPWK
jgi:hypothetical protein